MRRGQTTLEYVFLIGVAAAAFVAMIVYVSRSLQGNLRSQADQLGAWQYDPGKTTIDNHEAKTVSIINKSSSTTIVDYKNMNEPNNNPRLKELQETMQKLLGDINKLQDDYALEKAAVLEATVGSKAIRDNADFYWDSKQWNPDTSKGENRLDDIQSQLTKANNEYTAAKTEADLLEKAWSERTIEKNTTFSTGGSSESGDTDTQKNMSEILGVL